MANRYTIWMQYPDKYLNDISKIALKQTFPFNCIMHFNNEPAMIRDKIGENGFRTFFKWWANKKCQHRLKSATQKFCKYCKPGGIKDIKLMGESYEEIRSTNKLENDSKNDKLRLILKHKAICEINRIKNYVKSPVDLELKLNVFLTKIINRANIMDDIIRPVENIIRK